MNKVKGHPHIVKLLDYENDKEKGKSLMVLEFCKNKDLYGVIEAIEKKNIFFPLKIIHYYFH